MAPHDPEHCERVTLITKAANSRAQVCSIVVVASVAFSVRAGAIDLTELDSWISVRERSILDLKVCAILLAFFAVTEIAVLFFAEHEKELTWPPRLCWCWLTGQAFKGVYLPLLVFLTAENFSLPSFRLVTVDHEDKEEKKLNNNIFYSFMAVRCVIWLVYAVLMELIRGYATLGFVKKRRGKTIFAKIRRLAIFAFNFCRNSNGNRLGDGDNMGMRLIERTIGNDR